MFGKKINHSGIKGMKLEICCTNRRTSWWSFTDQSKKRLPTWLHSCPSRHRSVRQFIFLNIMCPLWHILITVKSRW